MGRGGSGGIGVKEEETGEGEGTGDEKVGREGCWGGRGEELDECIVGGSEEK